MIYFAFSSALTATNSLYFRKKHHALMDDNNTHKTNDELLGRLAKIKKEVKLKNAVLLEKIDPFLTRHGINDRDLRNKIIIALDKKDNIKTWNSVSQNTHPLQIDHNYIEILKTKLRNEYEESKAHLEAEISTIDNLPALLTYIDTNMSTNQISFGDKILPKAFIASYIAKLLQGKHLQLEDNQASSNNNNAHDEVQLEASQGDSSHIASSSGTALAFKPNKESSTDEIQPMV